MYVHVEKFVLFPFLLGLGVRGLVTDSLCPDYFSSRHPLLLQVCPGTSWAGTHFLLLTSDLKCEIHLNGLRLQLCGGTVRPSSVKVTVNFCSLLQRHRIVTSVKIAPSFDFSVA